MSALVRRARPFRMLAPFAVAAMAVIGAAAAVPAHAGIVINAEGVFLTAPLASQQPALNPNTGFRRFGRAGVFASPRDPGQAFSGRQAYGPAGRKLDSSIRDARRVGAERSGFQRLFSFE